MYEATNDTPDILGAEVSIDHLRPEATDPDASTYLLDLQKDLEDYNERVPDDQLESCTMAQPYDAEQIQQIIEAELSDPRADPTALLTVEDGLHRFINYREKREEQPGLSFTDYLVDSWDTEESYLDQ